VSEQRGEREMQEIPEPAEALRVQREAMQEALQVARVLQRIARGEDTLDPSGASRPSAARLSVGRHRQKRAET
jgi:hypothetical protein